MPKLPVKSIKNAAAYDLARILAGQNIFTVKNHKGRLTLKAARDGLLKIDFKGLLTVNACHGISAATLHGSLPVVTGQTVARVKVTAKCTCEMLTKAQMTAATFAPVIEVAAYQNFKVHILAAANKKALKNDACQTVKNTALLVQSLGGLVAGVVYRPYDMEAEIRRAFDAKAGIIVIAVRKKRDLHHIVRPALVNTGADIECEDTAFLPFAPVVLAYLHNVPVIAAHIPQKRKSASMLNILLPLLMAGEKPDAGVLCRLAYGGLCLRTCVHKQKILVQR